MKVKYFILIISFMTSILSYSQCIIINNQDAMIYSPEQIQGLNKRNIHLIQKSQYLKQKADSIYIYNIFHFNLLKKIQKTDILRSTFFNSLLLRPNYNIINNNSYPCADAIVINSDKNFLGVADSKYFYCASRYNENFGKDYLFLIENKDKFNVCCFFTFDGNWGKVFYGKTYNDELIVFHSKKSKPLTISSIKEFVEKFWDEYY